MDQPTTPSGAERRKAIRYYPDGAETFDHLKVVIEGYTGPAGVRNLSSSGISLIIEPGFEADSTLTVHLFNRRKLFGCVVPVRVVYLVERPAGDHILGGAFNRTLRDEELRALLS
jgi:hypothetical protein